MKSVSFKAPLRTTHALVMRLTGQRFRAHVTGSRYWERRAVRTRSRVTRRLELQRQLWRKDTARWVRWLLSGRR